MPAEQDCPIELDHLNGNRSAAGGRGARSLNAIWIRSLLRPGFNLQMLYSAVVILVLSVVGCKLTLVSVPNFENTVLAFVITAVVLMPLLLLLREKKRDYFIDLIMVVFWALFLGYMLNFPAEIAARLGSHISLKDDQLAQFDRALRLPIPAIVTWASRHWLGRIASSTYFWLFPFMRIAVLLPPLAGRAIDAKKFLVANLIMMAIGLPLFALVPAVGPWYGYHTIARPDQLDSQATLLFLRNPSPCQFRMPTGIVCFPSFHVVWALLCARALWSFRLLRVPAATLAALIIFSTVTTGEHYLIDLLGGAVIAFVAIVASEWLAKVPELPLSSHQGSLIP